MNKVYGTLRQMSQLFYWMKRFYFTLQSFPLVLLDSSFTKHLKLKELDQTWV